MTLPPFLLKARNNKASRVLDGLRLGTRRKKAVQASKGAEHRAKPENSITRKRRFFLWEKCIFLLKRQSPAAPNVGLYSFM
jgi:hypothetical protein